MEVPAQSVVQTIMTHFVLGLVDEASLSVRRDGRAFPLTGFLRVPLVLGRTILARDYGRR